MEFRLNLWYFLETNPPKRFLITIPELFCKFYLICFNMEINGTWTKNAFLLNIKFLENRKLWPKTTLGVVLKLTIKIELMLVEEANNQQNSNIFSHPGHRNCPDPLYTINSVWTHLWKRTFSKRLCKVSSHLFGWNNKLKVLKKGECRQKPKENIWFTLLSRFRL